VPPCLFDGRVVKIWATGNIIGEIQESEKRKKESGGWGFLITKKEGTKEERDSWNFDRSCGQKLETTELERQ